MGALRGGIDAVIMPRWKPIVSLFMTCAVDSRRNSFALSSHRLRTRAFPALGNASHESLTFDPYPPASDPGGIKLELRHFRHFSAISECRQSTARVRR